MMTSNHGRRLAGKQGAVVAGGAGVLRVRRPTPMRDATGCSSDWKMTARSGDDRRLPMKHILKEWECSALHRDPERLAGGCGRSLHFVIAHGPARCLHHDQMTARRTAPRESKRGIDKKAGGAGAPARLAAHTWPTRCPLLCRFGPYRPAQIRTIPTACRRERSQDHRAAFEPLARTSDGMDASGLERSCRTPRGSIRAPRASRNRQVRRSLSRRSRLQTRSSCPSGWFIGTAIVADRAASSIELHRLRPDRSGRRLAERTRRRRQRP